MGWEIDDGNSTCCEQEYAFSLSDNFNSPIQVSCAPNFTTTLLKNSNPLESNISFTTLSSLIGYAIKCYNASGMVQNVNYKGIYQIIKLLTAMYANLLEDKCTLY